MLRSRAVLALLLLLATANLLVFAVQRWAVLPLRVPSPSMEPGLQRGDRILVRHNYDTPQQLARRIDRGDVLVFRTPTASRQLVVKRVIGLPGETIEAHDGAIAIDDDRFLVEKWLPEEDRAPGSEGADSVDIPFTRLERNEVYVLGDNRESSIDSRSFGPVRLEDVVGTVALRFWPPSDIGQVDWS